MNETANWVVVRHHESTDYYSEIEDASFFSSKVRADAFVLQSYRAALKEAKDKDWPIGTDSDIGAPWCENGDAFLATGDETSFGRTYWNTYPIKDVDKRMLSKERYEQMLTFYDNDHDCVMEVVDDWGVDLCEKGYDIFYFGGTDMKEINRIDAVGAFADDEEATVQAIRDGIKIIPVEELPVNFDRRYLGWIDTPENRLAIQKYTDKMNQN